MDNSAKQGVLFEHDNLLNLGPAGTGLVTAAYQYSAGVNVSGFGEIVCYIGFTLGAAGGCNIKFQFGDDNTTWYEESAVRGIGATGLVDEVEAFRRYTASESRRIAFPVTDDWLRVGCQGIAAVDFDTTVFTLHLRAG